jgi:myotubularin-related protein 10/11/12
MHFVIPRQMSNTDYANFSKFFCGDRSVVWVWSIGYAAIVRMSYLTTPNINTSYENSMLERVRACDPERKEPKLMDLTKLLPSPSDVNTGYYKLRQICAPESDRNFMDQDKNFYTLLEKTNWLLYVSLCLKYSNEAARHMKLDRKTIVIQENNGRDMSCVISSLIQVLLDPFYRTITGIQTLIQKEWVSLGHPFSDRLGHVFSVNSEKSPMFLLFLDCVWQLLQQFPMDFEYSETFLTTIWDSAFVPIFDTFQFNCEYDRHNAIQNVSVSELRNN